jgi:hypothetical protein
LPFIVSRSPLISTQVGTTKSVTRSTVDGQRGLGQLTSRGKQFFTESVENPVEKIGENGIALQQSEEISRLHYRGAIDGRVNSRRTKPTDYTVITT